MLVLGRKQDEEIIIGDGIRVVVVAIKEGSVRIGIDAPNDVPVHRKEVLEKILREEELKDSSQ